MSKTSDQNNNWSRFCCGNTILTQYLFMILLYSFLTNSRCCCKETPSMTGWNHAIFYPQWNQQCCCSASTHAFHTSILCETCIYIKRASVCCANWIALSIEGIYCMTEFFWKQLLNEVRVKIILISPCHWWHFVTATSAIQRGAKPGPRNPRERGNAVPRKKNGSARKKLIDLKKKIKN